MKTKIKGQLKYFLITMSALAIFIVIMSVFDLLPEQDTFPDDATIRIIATGEEATVAFACQTRDGRRHGECRGRNMAITEDDDYWFLRFRGEHNIETNFGNGIYIRWRDFEIID